MWYVYLLLCDEKTYYIGITNNIKQRLIGHKNKDSIHTKQFMNIELIYCEKYLNKYEAAKREKQLKGWSHTKKQLLTDRKIKDPHYTGVDEVFRKDR